MPAKTGERMMHRGVVVPRSSLVKMLPYSSEPKQAFGSGRRGRLASADCGWIDGGWVLLRSPPLASVLLFSRR
jgi:hypothetical protein